MPWNSHVQDRAYTKHAKTRARKKYAKHIGRETALILKTRKMGREAGGTSEHANPSAGQIRKHARKSGRISTKMVKFVGYSRTCESRGANFENAKVRTGKAKMRKSGQESQRCESRVFNPKHANSWTNSYYKISRGRPPGGRLRALVAKTWRRCRRGHLFAIATSRCYVFIMKHRARSHDLNVYI